MYICRKRTRKVLVLDNALSVSEVHTITSHKEVEAEIREEMPRLKKRISRYSNYG